MVEVTIIIPPLHEAQSIANCIQKIKKIFSEYNIKGEIIVSDSSTDKTPEIAKKLGAKVVYPDKKGYGYAYIYAFKYAKGKYIVIGDGDATYDFTEIPKLLNPLKNGEADLVVGSRLKGKIMPGAMPWLHRYIGNPLLTKILNLFFKIGVSDAHCGFRAIKKDALQKLNLKAPGMEFASEMLIEAKRKNLKIKEVPITYHPRQGRSKLHSFRDGWRHLKFMLIQAPNWLYILPASIFFTIGVLLLTLGTFKINIGYIPGTYSMVIGSLVIILSLQITYLGIFSKLYGEIKGYFKSRMATWIKKHLNLEKG
ncbi:MAG: glycosyltransferase family 2 protein, partial [Thermoprotei archaeon]